MQNTGTMLCPVCAKKLPQSTSLCWHCGSDLRVVKLAWHESDSKANPYEVVPDGSNFGIALRGEVKLHGLDHQKAENLLEILNSVTDVEKLAK